MEAIYGTGHFDMMDDSEPYKLKTQVNRRSVDCWLEPVLTEGLFVDNKGKPRNRHVSGVLFTRRTTPILDNLSWKFFGNPFATHPAPPLFQQIPNVWPRLCDWTNSYEDSTTLHLSEEVLPYFPDGLRVGANPLSACATFKYQGVLQVDERDKVELQRLIGIDYPERDELLRIVQDAQRDWTA